MGFFSRWFKGADQASNNLVQPVEYKGFLIYQQSISENGQYRVAGTITKDIAGETLSHRFIRSDLLSNQQEADELMLSKAQVFIDQMNGKIFD